MLAGLTSKYKNAHMYEPLQSLPVRQDHISEHVGKRSMKTGWVS